MKVLNQDQADSEEQVEQQVKGRRKSALVSEEKVAILSGETPSPLKTLESEPDRPVSPAPPPPQLHINLFFSSLSQQQDQGNFNLIT